MRWRRWVLGGIGLLALAAACWFGWGAWLSNRFDERVAGMRAAGALQTWEDLRLPEPAPGTNGWHVLGEAADLLKAVEDARLEGEHADALSEMPPYWDAEEPWTEEERADAGRYLVRLTPYFHRLEEALAHPVLRQPLDAPFDASGGFMPVGNPLNRWYLAARHEPARTAWMLDRMIRLLDRWHPHTGLDALLFPIWWRACALRLLRDGLADGLHTQAHRAAWDEVFARAEARLAPLLSRYDLFGRATFVAWIEAWREGVDPLRELRRSVGELGDVVGREDVDVEGVDGLRAWIEAVTAGAEPPWFTRWYGKPRLYQLALEFLDECEREPLQPWRLTAMRFEPDHGVVSPKERTRAFMLRTAASLRLARIALVAREVPTNLRTDLKSFQLAVLERSGGVLDRDPIDGGGFLWRHSEGRWTVRVRPSPAHAQVFWGEEGLEGDALAQRLHEEVLVWEIPYP